MKPTTRIGLLTIGQAPRDDVVPEIQERLPPHIKIVQAGALDGLTLSEILAHRPRREAAVLITRLANGREVSVDRNFVHQALEKKVKSLEKKVDLIGILCSGCFPPLRARVPLVVPHSFIQSYVTALPGPVGVLVPSLQQVDTIVEEIRRWGVEALGAAVSPYTASTVELDKAIRGLTERGATAFMLHCFGYSQQMKDEVQAITGAPVLLVRSLLAAVLRELLW